MIQTIPNTLYRQIILKRDKIRQIENGPKPKTINSETGPFRIGVPNLKMIRFIIVGRPKMKNNIPKNRNKLCFPTNGIAGINKKGKNNATKTPKSSI